MHPTVAQSGSARSAEARCHDFASEQSANTSVSCSDSHGAFGVHDLTFWNELTRKEQRIIIKLYGGGSTRGNSSVETVKLMRLGLIYENGLTAAGLEVFIAAFKVQREARQPELLA
jgi:hypothetical protein